MIYSLAALSLVTVSCAPEETYTPGEKDVEGCYGVYFPAQEMAGATLDLDPTAPTTIELTVARQVPDGDVEVPVEITGDDVFVVEDIFFEDGDTETTVSVSFDSAKIGTRYSLSIKVTDPKYASIYSLDAQSISFSVTRVKWNLLIGPDGEETGLLRDDFFTPLYGVAVANIEGPVAIYERDDVPGLYRFSPLYDALFLANLFYGDPGYADAIQGAWFTSDESVIIDATNPDKVWIPRQPLGLTLSSADGAISILSCCKEAGFEGNYYGTLKDGVITFPAGGIAINFANDDDIQVNESGLFRICLPGVKPVDIDYSMALAVGESDDKGQIPFMVKMGADLAKVKVAAFEGTLSSSQVKANAGEMIAGTIESDEVTMTGVHALSDLGETGVYTLVAVGLNAEDAAVVTKSASFGYVAAGDEMPVIANVGLIVSDKHSPEGHTAMNSMEYYAYGEGITEAYMGLYKKQAVDEMLDAVIEDVHKYPLSKSELAQLNSTGISDLFTKLNPGTEYSFVLYAYNGYKSQAFIASAATEGLPDPLQMEYTLADLYQAEAKADYCKEWSFWAGTPQSNGRAVVGPVTVEDAGKQKYQYQDENGEIQEGEYDALAVSGVWKPVIDAGYLTDDTMLWEYYGGAIIPIHDYVGSFQDQSGNECWLAMLSFSKDKNGGFRDGLFCGALTEDGNVAFVDMETGQYAPYWFTSMGVFINDDYQGDLIAYDEMMFVDPANLPETDAKESSEPTTMMLDGIKAQFNADFNYVETPRTQLYRAIDNMNRKASVRACGEKAGIEVEISGGQVDCSVMPYDGKFETEGKRKFSFGF